MYDPQTRRLIQNAPALEALDLDRLPEEMTRAYASIVSFRISIQQLGTRFSKELRSELDRFRRLANTYEAYVAILPEGQDKISAAFVAASAHHLVNRADRLRSRKIRGDSRISRNYITSDVSALLLFLIAGYQADAAEMAKHINTRESSDLERALLAALCAVAEGKLERALATEYVQPDNDTDADIAATDDLWNRLFLGVQDLARRLLGLNSEDPIATFRDVQSDAVFEFTSESTTKEGVLGLSFVSAFSGPHQLATLLIQAGSSLLGQSVVNIPPPAGLGDVWTKVVQSLSKRRPYLWPNHMEALKSKILEQGTSTVISLPTGAGKTTVAELKIASTLASGGKVIYLVPTHSLADQVKKQLRDAFKEYSVSGSAVGEGFYAEVGEDDLPALMVMTPERCLTLLGVLGDKFLKTGLIVFDECHLLHPRANGADRRSIDAMLCVLKLFECAQNADFLLMSAMVSNVDELAEWISDSTGRPAIGIGIDWKPTRQARGCLVFKHTELDGLRRILSKEKKIATEIYLKKIKKPKSGPVPGVAVKRQLLASPLGFFSLRQSWNRNSEDYSILPLSPGAVQLAANDTWYLTPNKNAVAVDLGTRFAALGIKTLVFIQNRLHCESVAGQVADKLATTLNASLLTADEQALLQVAIEETGSKESVLGNFRQLAVCHHGLLLPSERHLTECLFARQDGPTLLTATPTLAQGMNLPAEVVIIAGDVRRDAQSERATPLEAHELLNAAGRAGRAGYVADGIVLVIPENVVDIDVENYKVGGKWGRLNEEVFAKTDQCLQIDDPLEYILDLIQENVDLSNPLVSYVARRLPKDVDGTSLVAERFLNRSLAAYRARRKTDEKRFALAVAATLSYRETLESREVVVEWMQQLSVSSAIPVAIIQSLDVALSVEDLSVERTTLQWVEWFFNWLILNIDFAVKLLPCEDIYEVVEKTLKNKILSREEVQQLLEKTRSLLSEWLGAQTLTTIERSINAKNGSVGTCNRARELVIRQMPHISYAIGLVAQVARGRLEAAGTPELMPLTLATLAACVRSGHSSPVHLAISHLHDPEISRVECDRKRERLGANVGVQSQTESFSNLLKRTARSIRNAKITR